MAIVAGVDFGTLSVRVSIVDSERGLLDSAVAEYPLHRKREDPEYATQSHDDHMRALAAATREAVKKAGISGDQVEAIALDTTGSSVIPVGKDLSHSANTICGAITAPKARLRRSRLRLIARGWKRSTGVAACIRRSGDSPNCCTGFAIIHPSVRNLSRRLSIATWWRPLCAA